jgi:hypothetical protein
LKEENKIDKRFNDIRSVVRQGNTLLRGSAGLRPGACVRSREIRKKGHFANFPWVDHGRAVLDSGNGGNRAGFGKSDDASAMVEAFPDELAGVFAGEAAEEAGRRVCPDGEDHFARFEPSSHEVVGGRGADLNGLTVGGMARAQDLEGSHLRVPQRVVRISKGQVA